MRLCVVNIVDEPHEKQTNKKNVKFVNQFLTGDVTIGVS